MEKGGGYGMENGYGGFEDDYGMMASLGMKGKGFVFRWGPFPLLDNIGSTLKGVSGQSLLKFLGVGWASPAGRV